MSRPARRARREPLNDPAARAVANHGLDCGASRWRPTKGRHQDNPAGSPMTTVQGRMVHEVTKPLRT